MIAALWLLSFGISSAQSHPPKHSPDHLSAEELKQRKEMFRQEMIQGLDLSESQVQEIEKIEQKYESEEDEIKNEYRTLREKRKDLNEKKKSEIESVFTPEQKAKTKEIRKNIRNREGQR